MAIKNSLNLTTATNTLPYDAVAFNKLHAGLLRTAQGLGAAVGVGVCAYGAAFDGTPDLTSLAVSVSGTTVTIQPGSAIFYDPTTYDFQPARSASTAATLTKDNSKPFIVAVFTPDTLTTGLLTVTQQASDPGADLTVLPLYNTTTGQDLRRFLNVTDTTAYRFKAVWSASTSYNANNVVIGSNGTWYYSRINANENHDPTTDNAGVAPTPTTPGPNWGYFGNMSSSGGSGYTPDTATVTTTGPGTGSDANAGVSNASTGTASLAFDGNAATYWQSSAGDATNAILGLDRGTGNTIVYGKAVITMRDSGDGVTAHGSSPRAIVVEASNDNFTTITRLGAYKYQSTSGTSLTRTLTFHNSNAFSAIRLRCFAPVNSSLTYISIAEVVYTTPGAVTTTTQTVNEYAGVLLPTVGDATSFPNGSVGVDVATGHAIHVREDGTVVDLEGPPALVAVTSSTTLVPDSQVILLDGQSGAFDATLPTAASYVRPLLIKRRDNSGTVTSNVVRVVPASGETIDGAAFKGFAMQNESYFFARTGPTSWGIW